MFGRSADCTDDRPSNTTHSIQMTQRIPHPSPGQPEHSFRNSTATTTSYVPNVVSSCVCNTHRPVFKRCPGNAGESWAIKLFATILADGPIAESPSYFFRTTYPYVSTYARISAGTSRGYSGFKRSQTCRILHAELSLQLLHRRLLRPLLPWIAWLNQRLMLPHLAVRHSPELCRPHGLWM